MTYENCKKYMNEAKDEETKAFWDARIKRKYPEQVVAKEKKVAQKAPKQAPKDKKKVIKESKE